MAVIQVTKDNIDSEVFSYKGNVLIDFYADWCGPCRMLSPVVEEISNDFPQYRVCKVNIDEQPELAQRFGVTSVPTLFVVKQGMVVNQSVGVVPKRNIILMLR
ncbi:MAG: thioredoxin [Oscillospiraceae bacterium]|nr:thioredoxin [Oscillospiraceae bacterium]